MSIIDETSVLALANVQCERLDSRRFDFLEFNQLRIDPAISPNPNQDADLKVDSRQHALALGAFHGRQSHGAEALNTNTKSPLTPEDETALP